MADRDEAIARLCSATGVDSETVGGATLVRIVESLTIE